MNKYCNTLIWIYFNIVYTINTVIENYAKRIWIVIPLNHGNLSNYPNL